jgi:hypothetical protein
MISRHLTKGLTTLALVAAGLTALAKPSFAVTYDLCADEAVLTIGGQPVTVWFGLTPAIRDRAPSRTGAVARGHRRQPDHQPHQQPRVNVSVVIPARPRHRARCSC